MADDRLSPLVKSFFIYEAGGACFCSLQKLDPSLPKSDFLLQKVKPLSKLWRKMVAIIITFFNNAQPRFYVTRLFDWKRICQFDKGRQKSILYWKMVESVRKTWENWDKIICQFLYSLLEKGLIRFLKIVHLAQIKSAWHEYNKWFCSTWKKTQILVRHEDILICFTCNKVHT